MDPVSAQTMAPGFGWESMVFVVALLAVGIAMLCVELFVLPGFGVGGIIGIVLLLGGTISAWVLLGPAWGALVVVATVALTIALFIAAMKSGILKRRFVHEENLDRGHGTQSEELAALVGSRGTASTDLRPAGIAKLGDQRVDVVSEGGFVERGTAIEVVAVSGPRIVVYPIEGDTQDQEREDS
ncbi:MAG: NfeD family protein [Polyangia bacterium]